MKFLANDFLHLLNSIETEKVDSIYLSLFYAGIKLYWENEDNKIHYLIRKKSGILPTSINGKTYSIDIFPFMGVKRIISQHTVEFNGDKSFLIDVDFESQKKNQLFLYITDTERGSGKTIKLTEVFNIPCMPDPIVKAYANSHDSKSHLRLAKCVAENGEVGIEFGGNRMKISGLSKEIFFGGVITDYAAHDDFWMPHLKVPVSSISHVLGFKDSSVCWAETEPGELTFIGDDGTVSMPYRESSTECQHLIDNKQEGWFGIDRNALIKQIEGVTHPIVNSQSSVQIPIKSITTNADGFVIETDDYQVNASTTAINAAIKGVALLESFQLPQKDSVYADIVELEAKGGTLTVTGFDGRKRKTILKNSGNVTGYWRGSVKKLVKLLTLLSEYDNKIQVILDHPRLQVQTNSGASILILGCELVEDDFQFENRTQLNCSEKPIILFPEKSNELGASTDEEFLSKIFRLHQLKRLASELDNWVNDLPFDFNQMEEISHHMNEANILIDFLPDGNIVPSFEGCLQEEGYYRYGMIMTEDNDMDKFMEEIDCLLHGLSLTLGRVIRYCLELPVLMQYTF